MKINSCIVRFTAGYASTSMSQPLPSIKSPPGRSPSSRRSIRSPTKKHSGNKTPATVKRTLSFDDGRGRKKQAEDLGDLQEDPLSVIPEKKKKKSQEDKVVEDEEPDLQGEVVVVEEEDEEDHMIIVEEEPAENGKKGVDEKDENSDEDVVVGDESTWVVKDASKNSPEKEKPESEKKKSPEKKVPKELGQGNKKSPGKKELKNQMLKLKEMSSNSPSAEEDNSEGEDDNDSVDGDWESWMSGRTPKQVRVEKGKRMYLKNKVAKASSILKKAKQAADSHIRSLTGKKQRNLNAEEIAKFRKLQSLADLLKGLDKIAHKPFMEMDIG